MASLVSNCIKNQHEESSTTIISSWDHYKTPPPTPKKNKPAAPLKHQSWSHRHQRTLKQSSGQRSEALYVMPGAPEGREWTVDVSCPSPLPPLGYRDRTCNRFLFVCRQEYMESEPRISAAFSLAPLSPVSRATGEQVHSHPAVFFNVHQFELLIYVMWNLL